MIADVFYPIFTLTITILVCFIRRKSKIVQRFAYPRSPRHRPGPLRGLKAPSRLTGSNAFGFVKNRWAHIFSVLSPAGFRVNLHFIVCLNVKKILARGRHHTWSLSGSNRVWAHNHLCKQTLSHLAKLTVIQFKDYGSQREHGN